MSWTERLKLTFRTFKHTALPLYLWYLIFFVAFVVLGAILFILPLGQFFSKNLPFLDQFNINQFSHVSYANAAYSNPFGFFDSSLLMEFLLLFFLIIVIFILFGAIATSLIYTGTFHLAVKGIEQKASFRDFRFTGSLRILGWYLLITAAYILYIVAGVVFGAVFSLFSETVLFVYMIIYGGIFLVGSIYLLPWFLSAGYYLVAHLELSFSTSLKRSWNFARNNMGKLWGAFGLLLLFSLIIGLLQELFESIGADFIGWIIYFLTSPFTALIPVVWTISLLREREGLFQQSNVDDPSYFEQEKQTYYFTDTPPAKGMDNPKPVDYPKPVFDDTERIPPVRTLHTGDRSVVTHEDRTGALPQYEVNFCTNCGTPVKANTTYCSRCGVKIR